MTTWKDWEQAQLAKLPQPEVPKGCHKPLPKRLLDMHRLYGRAEGKLCKTCRWLGGHAHDRVWHKCTKSRVTNGAGTDWRLRWPACGLHEEEHHEQKGAEPPG